MAEGKPKKEKAKKVVDPKKVAAREAKRAKRKAALTELKTKDEQTFKVKLDWKTAKDMGVCATYKDFCLMKAAVLSKYWNDKAVTPVTGKKLEKKQKRKEKLLAMLKALEGELGDGDADAKTEGAAA